MLGWQLDKGMTRRGDSAGERNNTEKEGGGDKM